MKMKSLLLKNKQLTHDNTQLRQANEKHKSDKEQLKARIDEITAYKWSNLTVCAILSFALGVAARTLIQ